MGKKSHKQVKQNGYLTSNGKFTNLLLEDGTLRAVSRSGNDLLIGKGKISDYFKQDFFGRDTTTEAVAYHGINIHPPGTLKKVLLDSELRSKLPEAQREAALKEMHEQRRAALRGHARNALLSSGELNQIEAERAVARRLATPISTSGSLKENPSIVKLANGNIMMAFIDGEYPDYKLYTELFDDSLKSLSSKTLIAEVASNAAFDLSIGHDGNPILSYHKMQDFTSRLYIQEFSGSSKVGNPVEVDYAAGIVSELKIERYQYDRYGTINDAITVLYKQKGPGSSYRYNSVPLKKSGSSWVLNVDNHGLGSFNTESGDAVPVISTNPKTAIVFAMSSVDGIKAVPVGPDSNQLSLKKFHTSLNLGESLDAKKLANGNFIVAFTVESGGKYYPYAQEFSTSGGTLNTIGSHFKISDKAIISNTHVNKNGLLSLSVNGNDFGVSFISDDNRLYGNVHSKSTGSYVKTSAGDFRIGADIDFAQRNPDNVLLASGKLVTAYDLVALDVISDPIQSTQCKGSYAEVTGVDGVQVGSTSAITGCYTPANTGGGGSLPGSGSGSGGGSLPGGGSGIVPTTQPQASSPIGVVIAAVVVGAALVAGVATAWWCKKKRNTEQTVHPSASVAAREGAGVRTVQVEAKQEVDLTVESLEGGHAAAVVAARAGEGTMASAGATR